MNEALSLNNIPTVVSEQVITKIGQYTSFQGGQGASSHAELYKVIRKLVPSQYLGR